VRRKCPSAQRLSFPLLQGQDQRPSFISTRLRRKVYTLSHFETLNIVGLSSVVHSKNQKSFHNSRNLFPTLLRWLNSSTELMIKHGEPLRLVPRGSNHHLCRHQVFSCCHARWRHSEARRPSHCQGRSRTDPRHGSGELVFITWAVLSSHPITTCRNVMSR